MSDSENIQEDCYRFESLEYSQWLFDSIFENTIDATYIIHLEGNGRLEQVKEQLKIFQPTRKIYILHNKGYKKCVKYPEINKPYLDLIDAFLEVFRHAQEKGYGNILVLEDDFQFNNQILLPEHRDEVAMFLTEHKDKDFMYKLGCIPCVMVPMDIQAKNQYLFFGVGCHAVVYSQKLRERILNEKQEKIIDWDIYHNLNSRTYTYHKPLCYQLFPSTENQSYWGEEYWYLKPFVPFFLLIFNSLHLDTQVEPGYSYFYIFAKIVFSFLCLLAVGLLIWITRPLFSFVFRRWMKKRKTVSTIK